MLPSTTLETASSYNVSVLFGDIVEVVDGRATSWDYVSGRNISRPSAKGKIGGFPCQDASSLNERHRTSTNRNAIADNSLRTGKVFNAIVAIDEDDASSEWAIYENVVPLAAQPRNDDGSIVGPSNLAVSVHIMLRTRGRFVAAFHLDAHDLDKKSDPTDPFAGLWSDVDDSTSGDGESVMGGRSVKKEFKKKTKKSKSTANKGDDKKACKAKAKGKSKAKSKVGIVGNLDYRARKN